MLKSIRSVAFLAATLSCVCASAATSWVTSLDERSGLPIVEVAGTPAVRAGWSFWGPNWAWAEFSATVVPGEKGAYEVSGKSPSLGFSMVDHVSASADRSQFSEFHFQSGAGRPDVTGGGMIFKFDLAKWRATMGEPELLPNNAGWRWGISGGPQFEMRFEPPLASIYFEKGDKRELRAFVFAGKVPPGELVHRATWRTSGAVEARPMLSQRLGTAPSTWPTDPLTSTAAIPFLRELDKDRQPAGSHGPVHVDKGELVFKDGSPARFWGTNVAAYALFSTPHDEVQRQAKRLASLGYNLVRLHHMDSLWVGFNVFGRRGDHHDTGTLDDRAMGELDWWIKCLSDEGIYVWLDLHVERPLLDGDGIEGFDEIRKGKPTASLKGYNYVNASIQQAMKRFNAEYLGHVNGYTKLAYKDDPAVVAVLLTNENDLTQHFGNGLLPDKHVPLHAKLFEQEAARFASQTGLPLDKVQRTWEPGAAKPFLNDLEHRFDVTMLSHLRGMGARMPVATTSSWGESPLWSLPALTTGDVVDAHSYSHYGALEANPLYAPNFVDWIGASHVVGMPLTVTEWNAEPFPTPDRHVLPLYVAATAAHQGWNAMMNFAYTQSPTNKQAAGNWNAYNDPALMAMMPAAALLYRERHVAESSTTYVFDADAATFFDRATSARTSVALRGAMERGKLLIAMPSTPYLPWLRRFRFPEGATLIKDPDISLLPADASGATSDDGQLTRNWDQGVFTIDTARTRAAMGWIGGRDIRLHEVSLAVTTPSASVAVQSLEEATIGKSGDLLVSISTRSQPQVSGRAPFVSEPLRGAITIRAMPGLSLWSVDGLAKPKGVQLNYQDGAYTLTLDGSAMIHWLELSAHPHLAGDVSH
jgi:hypothetical protein